MSLKLKLGLIGSAIPVFVFLLWGWAVGLYAAIPAQFNKAAWDRDFEAELDALLKEGLTQEQIDDASAKMRECLVIGEELERITDEVEKEYVESRRSAGEWIVLVGVDLSVLGRPAATPEDEAVLEVSEQALRRYREAGLVERAERALDMARVPTWEYFRVDPSNPDQTAGLDYLGRLRRLSLMLQAEAKVWAAVGDWVSVCRSFRVRHRMSNSMFDEPALMIDKLVGLSLATQWYKFVREILVDRGADGEGLAALAACYDQLQFSVIRPQLFDAQRLNDLYVQAVILPTGTSQRAIFLPQAVRASEVVRARMNERWHLSAQERFAQPLDTDEILRQELPLLHPGRFMMGGVSEQVLQIVDQFECEWRGVRLMLAIEVFRARRGELPGVLEELVPDCIAALPIDPYAPDGKFRYRRVEPAGDVEGSDYLLHSVGLDGKDDQGTEPVGTESYRHFEATRGKCTGCDFVINRYD